MSKFSAAALIGDNQEPFAQLLRLLGHDWVDLRDASQFGRPYQNPKIVRQALLPRKRESVLSLLKAMRFFQERPQPADITARITLGADFPEMIERFTAITPDHLPTYIAAGNRKRSRAEDGLLNNIMARIKANPNLADNPWVTTQLAQPRMAERFSTEYTLSILAALLALDGEAEINALSQEGVDIQQYDTEGKPTKKLTCIKVMASSTPSRLLTLFSTGVVSNGSSIGLVSGPGDWPRDLLIASKVANDLGNGCSIVPVTRKVEDVNNELICSAVSTVMFMAERAFEESN